MALRPLTADDVATAAELHGVPPELALAIWQQESTKGRNAGVSPKGARGGFQVMPGTFNDMMPGGNIDDPVDNMYAGIKYLAHGLKQSGGDPEGAAQVYYHGKPLKPDEEGPNSGPGTPTTREYGRQVMAKMDAQKKARGVTPDSAPVNLFGDLNASDEAAESMPDEDDNDISDIAGLTRPLDLSTHGEWMGPENHDYELDKYVRSLVDQEFKNQNA